MILLAIIVGLLGIKIGVSYLIDAKKENERIRKFVVTIKRNTHLVPLVMMVISFFIYSSQMTSYSNSIALISEPGMGLAFFINTLFSILSIITFLLAFPRRQKPKYMNIVITIFMLIVIITTDIFIYDRIIYGTQIKENPIEITKARNYINKAKIMGIVHMILTSLNLLLICTLPVYKKWIEKIKTTRIIENSTINRISELDVAEDID